jgi:opacity protein-like surface antigen
VAVWFGVVLAATLASAQIPTSGNIFVGYSFERTNWSGLTSESGGPNLNGWEASLEGKIFPHLGIVTDFGSHYGSQSFTALTPNGPFNTTVSGHQWELLFGPRASVSVGKFTPFAEAMIGIAHVHNGDFFDSSNSSFAEAVGGGIDYRLVRLLALRLEADYIHTHLFDTTQNNFRLSTGIVFRF